MELDKHTKTAVKVFMSAVARVAVAVVNALHTDLGRVKTYK